MTPAQQAYTLLALSPRGLWSWELADVLEVPEERVTRVIVQARRECKPGEAIRALRQHQKLGAFDTYLTRYKIVPDYSYGKARQLQRCLPMEGS